ncbi:MAG: glycosyltransferase family 4 protein [Kordiimonas sp.]
MTGKTEVTSEEKSEKTLRICVVSDAWTPQVNGVVRTLQNLRKELKKRGHKVYMLTPKLFKTIPCPTYPEIPLAVNTLGRVPAILKRWNVDAIHIATEGPIGWAARRWCLKNDFPFTTAYHTAFPEYIAARTPLSANLFYPIFRRFHAASAGVLVATPTVRQQLADKGFKNIVPWTRGVDTSLYSPSRRRKMSHPGPVQLYVGRVAVEKNIEAFLETNVPGTKLVVGDGPAIEQLRNRYPSIHFLGAKFGEELAKIYASADVFVFPSKTDTFGLVMIEALATGTPVAAYPVQGPIDVVGEDGSGPFSNWSTPIAALQEDLNGAIENALICNREACAEFVKFYNWPTVAEQFLSALKMKAQNA